MTRQSVGHLTHINSRRSGKMQKALWTFVHNHMIIQKDDYILHISRFLGILSSACDMLHLSIVEEKQKHSIATITQWRSLELLIAKTPILHMLYYMNWLTHDFWTRTGGCEFDRSHGAGTSSPSHWQQVEEQAPKPVGWMMCFLLMTFVPVQKLCVNIYIYIYICIFYMSSVFFGLPIVSCSLMIMV